MEPTTEDIQKLRSSFLKKIEVDAMPEGGFHPADMAKIKNGDEWVRRFLLHHDNDQTNALQMMWDTCEWRKKFGANDISEKNVNMSILESGSLFSHNRDKDGRSLLIFKSKKHQKGNHDFEDEKRCLVYWMERLERQDKGEMVSIMFDMDGAGLSNMDMEYTKYLISLFKNYYPQFLNYILIYEMAWVLSATFKIIKSWLPAKAVQKIKFLNKSTIKEFIDKDQCLKSWGGTDEYVFKFIPEQRTTPIITSDKVIEDSRKKVHFADGSPVNDNTAIYESNGNTALAIQPVDVIHFTHENNELVGYVTLTNNEPTTISYKIKTTSPEKFRVRPSTGVLTSGASVTIHVVLQHGFHGPTLARDKFLIMSLPLDKNELSTQELTDLWKTQQSSGSHVEQHRLRCSLTQSNNPEPTLKNGSAYGVSVTDEQQLSRLTADINRLNMHLNNVREELKSVQRLQLVVILGMLFLAILVIYAVKQNEVTPVSQPDQSCNLFPTEQ